MAYTKFHNAWANAQAATGGGDETTPISAAALDWIEAGIFAAAAMADAASAGSASDIQKSIVDAKGDIIVATAADTVARKAVGATDAMALRVKAANADGLEWAFPPGHEFDVASITASFSVTATAESAAQTIVSGAAVTYDGSTPILLEFFCPRVTLPNVASIAMVFSLWDGSTEVARLGVFLRDGTGTGNFDIPVFLRHRFTPSAASHTYSVRGHMSAAGTGVVTAGVGTGGAGINIPTHMRQVKA